ncbi:hypothetical protein CPB84DRAFT_1849869 [Gymnopilus junonius]|uniref:Uncharacterized protein n=1 Tax=Gymnopilus junonius TaxID=109634 RepID=A0A9P5NJN3_GYMJU|nr:hypothetical protein CPB84DRAFT_1849869 [Gymnopilus junonius]
MEDDDEDVPPGILPAGTGPDSEPSEVSSSMPSTQLSVPVESIDEFIKSTPIGHDIIIYTQLLATKNKLNNMVKASLAFTVSQPLMNIIMHDHVHVPNNIDLNVFAKKVINSAIKEELTQAHSKIKKAIRASFRDSDSSLETIYSLALNVITNTQLAAIPALCAWLALLCALFIKDISNGDPKYWNKVDEQLLEIRTKAGQDKDKIKCAFK